MAAQFLQHHLWKKQNNSFPFTAIPPQESYIIIDGGFWAIIQFGLAVHSCTHNTGMQ